MNQIYNPVIPFNGPIPGGMHPGRMMRIQGNIPPFSQRFAVNLLCGAAGDIALHLSPDFHKHHVIRNSVQQMRWGHEEKHGHLPIRPGQNFDLVIFCEPHQYKIAFNGAHFTEFNHRIPFNHVTNLAIDGQVSITFISFEGAPTASHGPPATGFVPSAPFPPQGATFPGPFPHPAPAGPGYPTPGYGPPVAPYPTQPGHHGYPQPHPGHYGTKDQGTYPHSPTQHRETGLLDKAGMAIAGALGASALMGGSKYNKLGMLGGLGTTGAILTGNPKKALKKQAKMQKKALKYGLPIAGAGLGAYALHKGMHKIGHHHRSSSSSSSSSSD